MNRGGHLRQRPVDMLRLPQFPAPSLDDTDRRWLGTALLVGGLVYVAYLSFYPWPAQGAGFYLAIAEQINQHGYALPRRIPYYTAGGVPYAYPPLMFYVLAVALDLGADPFALARVLPGLVTVAALVPFYYLARAVLRSPVQAGVATLLLAVTPSGLQWHVASGGVVRAPAFLFALGTCHAGWRLFADGDRRWLVPAIGLFAATVLTHPVYAMFVGVSYLVFYAAVDRSPRGLAFGLTVAAGGALLSAPWWLTITARHGLEIFSAAAGTHEGIGGGISRLVGSFLLPLLTLDGDLPLYFLTFGGCVVLLTRRRYVLPIWILAVGYALRQPRFLFVPGAMAGAVLLVDVLAPWIHQSLDAVGEREALPRVAPATVGRMALAALAITTLLTAGWVTVSPVTGPELVPPADDQRYAATPLPPMYAVEDDVAAMAWIETNTPPDARFVVLGDAAEWFPYVTHRTMVLSPWGAEWEGPDAFRRHRDQYDTMAACRTATCVTNGLREENLDPDYLYLQTGHYTVRRMPHYRGPETKRSFVESNRYEVVFENDGGFVVRVVRPG